MHLLNHRIFNWIQRVIGSKLWFYGCIILTLVWMGWNGFVYLFGGKPFDSPQEFYPFIVLIYTLLSLWVENAVKVQQKEQQDIAADQLRKIEEMNEKLIDSQKIMIATVHTIQKMVEDNARQEDLFNDMLTVVDGTVEAVAKNTDDILQIVKGGER